MAQNSLSIHHPLPLNFFGRVSAPDLVIVIVPVVDKDALVRDGPRLNAGLARVRAILRRARADNGEANSGALPERFVVGDVELDKGTRVVTRGGREVTLTTVEFDLLEMLLRSAGHIVTREDLVKSILGRNFTPYDRSIDTHVSNLRRRSTSARGRQGPTNTSRCLSAPNAPALTCLTKTATSSRGASSARPTG